MLATLIPIFRADMSVASYCLYAQKENMYQNPHRLGTGAFDGAGNILGIEVIENLTFDNLSKDCTVLLPVNNISIFSDIDVQFKGPKNRVILLVDASVKPESNYIKRLKALKDMGFVLAMKDLQVYRIAGYKELLDLFSIFFIDCDIADPVKQANICRRLIPSVALAAENIANQEIFEAIKSSGYFTYFEGPFYRVPISKRDTDVTPLKANYIKLLSLINNVDFDLTKVADIIAKDPALTISLLNVVNKLTVNSNISSIRQATALLGQRELKRWLNTFILSNLCTDKPNEITRLSLLRAKFAENLAGSFRLAMKTEELFLMGLFSVLDYILDKPMSETLKSVSVSQEIYAALVNGTGPYAKLLDFELKYEAGDWQEVSRQIVVEELDMDLVYKSYTDALLWYKNMFT